MSIDFRYPKGSKWRKWDLEVHTPFSYLNQQFGNDFDVYIKQLFKKAIEKGIATIGITDYFTIDGYKKLENEYLNNNKLTELGFTGEEIRKTKQILVVPNIEFRLNKLVGTQRINFHVIFSRKVSINDIEENFLREIKFIDQGTPQSRDEERPLTVGNLQELGKRLKREHSEFRHNSDIQVGMMNAVVDDTKIMEILYNKASIFQGKYLIFVPADEDLSKIQWDGQDHNVRKVIIQKCHGLFSPRTSTIEWALGKKHLTPEDFIKEFKSLKPCIWGSDAHSYGEIFEPDLQRYTWIKADPTFEGFKQIIYEPEERIYIGQEPPRKVDRSKIIKSITISNSNQWFENNKPTSINEGLVSIIGGKGTGKSALLDVTAYAAGSYKCYEKDATKSKSFLKKAFKELEGLAIKLEWDEGNPDQVTIADKLEESIKEGRVRYLPQDFIDQLCSEIGKSELEEQIENVIFQQVPPEDRASFTDFKNYKEAQLKVISDKKNRVVQQIEEINTEIYGHNKLIKSKDGKNEETRKVNSEIERFQKEMEKISESLKDSGDQKEILGRLNSSIEQRSKQEKMISELNAKLRKIEEVKNEICRFLEDSKTFIKRLRDELREVEITQEEIESIKVVLYPENVEQILSSKKKKLKDKIESDRVELGKTRKNIEDFKSKITIEKSKQDKIVEINKSLPDLTKKQDSLNRDIKRIEEAEKERIELSENRKNLFINYFKLIFEEKEVLKEIYSPLERLLKESAEENEKFFDFTVEFNSDVEVMAREGDRLIDHSKKGRFFRYDWEFLKIQLEKLRFSLNLNSKQLCPEDKTQIGNFLEKVENLFKHDEEGKQNAIISQLRKEHTKQNFDDWLYSAKYYSISFSIKFNGVELNNLSPGLKGIALLILFLELDKDDRRPILIDQPEENLDNRSVYVTLMKYFREAKKRRQVIIVTHNPNLVVNADSEQVIVANFDKGLGKQTSRIAYVSGSLENTFKDDSATDLLEKKGIREHVCEILEGGEEAFKKREDKYQFK